MQHTTYFYDLWVMETQSWTIGTQEMIILFIFVVVFVLFGLIFRFLLRRK